MTGLVIQEQHEEAHQDGKDRQIGDGADKGDFANHRHILQGTQGHLGIGTLEAAQGVVACDDGTEAIDNGLHAQGCDEGGNLQESDDAAVDGAEHRHNGDDDHQCHKPGDFRHPGQGPGVVIHALEHHGGEAGGEAHLTACRQVRTLGDQAPGNAAGDDEPGGHVDNQVFKVVRCEKVIRNDADHQGQNNNQDDNRVVGQKILDSFRVDPFILHFFSPPYSNWVARAMMFS